VASLSGRTLVYKALVQAPDLQGFYPDLLRKGYETSFAIFHQRFSTNTLPRWSLVQPFRMSAHNGEINTIAGNRAWMRAREASLACPKLGVRAGDLGPILPASTSDSGSLDEALSLLVHAGRRAWDALTLLVPPAYEAASIPDPLRAFFDCRAAISEPWDGPALVVFGDGRSVGAALDRNGLRPARSLVTRDGLVLVASEAGVLRLPPERVLSRGRLGPGEVVAVDLQARRLLDRDTIREHLAARLPYRRLLDRARVSLSDLAPAAALPEPPPEVGPLRAFGYTREEIRFVLGPMAREGAEAVGSMGDDAPLAVLSEKPCLLFSYFKQRFAQVTNPALDPLREGRVMSMATLLGPRGDLLKDVPEGPLVLAGGPVLESDDLARLLSYRGWKAATLGLLVPAGAGAPGFEDALDELVEASCAAARDGASLLVLSDRGVDAGHAALPSLLAVSAVHQELVRRGLRLRLSLVADTGEARTEHQVATLIAFGAEAVCPHLALALVASEAPGGAAAARYGEALTKGLRKILSKSGISLIRSYHGSQLFEAVGLHPELVDRYFPGTPSPIGGLRLGDVAAETLARHAASFPPAAPPDLEEGGDYRYRQRGETHAFEPRVVKALHEAARSRGRLAYPRFAALVADRPPVVLRDLLEVRKGAGVPPSDVESVRSLLPRFMTSAMSLGAVSPEAQRTLAVAMNRIGARSNSGEGGEPAELYWKVLPGGDRAGHRVKQVASARFGVTTDYLVAADELQIKIAQGSKPGEGGQLPGHKVTPLVAAIRHASPGTPLISPPPHHDIYSIEDLAELIYELRRVNPRAAVGVKIVSSAGVGTIAVGIAKAGADAILVSGHDGGTGASPLGSIKNAGMPWELGLAEAHRALVLSGLRPRVRLQVDGGFKTGRDVVIAAALGAQEFGFGSAALVAAGCVMARQCHLNTCPVGIATQSEALRLRYRGTPADVVRFFTAVAREVREILAYAGFDRLDALVGRVDVLEERFEPRAGKARSVSLRGLLEAPRAPSLSVARRPPSAPEGIDEAVLGQLRTMGGLPRPLSLSFPVTNADRAVGARIAGDLALRLRGRTLPENTVRLSFRGSAGQSFGAFLVGGMRLELEGEANDFVGKGMSGGEIVVRPHPGVPEDSVIAGNTVLYGATGGRLFMAGRAGERFAVRNSGALAVVEGVGDHACEYMTAGAVVLLGPWGDNLAAGMTGGTAFVLDPEGVLPGRHNPDLVSVESVPEREEAWLVEALELHVRATASRTAAALLGAWDPALFRVLAPRGLGERSLPALAGDRVDEGPAALLRPLGAIS
jgi:glutamate synthase domain-containing protein 2/glutamate synthase domain-containing protein 3